MSKGLRLSETWFNRGLWVIALIFAAFLIGLGSLVVGDLPQVEESLSVERYMDAAAVQPGKERCLMRSRRALFFAAAC